jgi:antitoxin (DNA-binding transcriptional repressor) of toxin-antitoxin stability system
MTTTADVRDVQKRLKELLTLVAAGNEVILMDGNKPLARLVPVSSPVTSRTPGLHPGVIQTSDDFDEPLPDDFWTGNA